MNLLNESLKGRPLTPFSPFAYFSTGSIFKNGGFVTLWLVLDLLLVGAFLVATYVRYLRKDMPSV